MIGIYKITEKNNPNNFYIGKSNDIERRFAEHQTKDYSQSRIPFDQEIKDKGKDNFTYEILELCKVEELSEREKYWTDKLNATSSGNIYDGGLTDVVGDNNPNAKLTTEDIIYIRTAYNNHKKQKDIYELYKDKISFAYFKNIWQGRSWAHIMPEVYTEENKNYYIYENSYGEKGTKALLSDAEVIELRKRYQTETAKQLYKGYENKIKFQTFQAMLWGRSYKHLPIYKK